MIWRPVIKHTMQIILSEMSFLYLFHETDRFLREARWVFNTTFVCFLPRFEQIHCNTIGLYSTHRWCLIRCVSSSFEFSSSYSCDVRAERACDNRFRSISFRSSLLPSAVRQTRKSVCLVALRILRPILLRLILLNRISSLQLCRWTNYSHLNITILVYERNYKINYS